MGAPSYCKHCGGRLEWATAAEAAEGSQRCGSCGESSPANRELGSALEELSQSVVSAREELEALRAELRLELYRVRHELKLLKEKP